MQRLVPTLFLFSAVFAGSSAAATALEGTVVRAGDGAPVADARVTVRETGRTARTNAEGAFSVDAPSEGTATLVVAAPGFRVATRVLQAPFPDVLEIAVEPLVGFADRIEVTATRAREGRDPVTATDIPAQRIEDTYWGQDPAILLGSLAPGYYAYNDNGNGIGYSYFTIRGFGQARSRVTLNGAPLNDAESGELFFIDLADFLSTAGDIQVRRGVFGLSGIGGAVDITTAHPPLEPQFTIHLGGGSFDTQRFSARYASGLIDGRWAIDARYSKITTDGYRDQAWVDMWNYYFALARYGERSTLRLVLFGGPEQTHLAYEGVSRSVLQGGLTGDPDQDRRFNPLSWPGEVDNFTQPHYQVLHDLQLSPDTTLSQTFYLFQGDGYYEQYKSDRRLVEYNLPDIPRGDGTFITRTDLVRRRSVDEWDAGWVPTLQHELGDVTVTVRGEARLHRAHHWGEVRWAQHYPEGVDPNRRYYDYEVEKRTAGVSVEATWRPSDRLDLQAGLQFAHHAYRMHDDALLDVKFTDAFDFLLPRAGAVVHLSPEVDVYLHVARGMREPAFRNLYDPQDYYGTRSFLDPEDVWDWETGVVVRRPAWEVRANAFWMEFANEIVYAGALDDSGVPVYGNGARSRHRGVEVEASWRPLDPLNVFATATLSDNTFTRYREYGWDGSVSVYDGNRIAGYPDRLGTLSASWQAGPVRLVGTVRHAGRFYLDNSEDNRRDPELRTAEGYVRRVNPAYTVLDAGLELQLGRAVVKSLGFSGARLELRLNNLLDETYTAFGYLDSEPVFIPAAGRNFYAGVSLDL